MHFGEPDNLYFLMGLIPLVAIAVWYGWWRGQVRRRIGDPELVDRMTANHSQRLRWTRISLALLGVALICLTAAKPRWGRTDTRLQKEGLDVVFALDLSKSMLARDAAPSRLEAAAEEIKSTLQRLDGDRVGLVVFTAVSFAQSPLTSDYGAIRFYLDKLDPSQMSVGGTAIGRALRDSVELLTGERPGGSSDAGGDGGTGVEMERAENQVIVLITDGEDHETDPVEAARQAKKKGIHVVTVGIGSPDGAKIPKLDADGNVTGYKRDRNNNVITTKLEEEQLQKIARKAQGRYLRYEGVGSIAKELTNYVDSLEKTQFNADMAQQYHDRFMWFLVPGVLLLVLSLVIGERSDGRLGWRIGGESSASWKGGLFGLVLAALLIVGVGCDDALKSPHAEVERGNNLLEEGSYGEAASAFESAAEDERIADSPRLAYNRGVAALHRRKYQEARTYLGRALQAPDPADRFAAHYSMGLTFVGEESWKQAAKSFQEALEVAARHDGVVDEKRLARARRNVELAYRKLYPPCRTLEDKREENDQPGQATRLKKPKAEDLTLCGGDDDWFALPVIPGATVTVEATFRQLRDPADPTRPFLPRPEDLNITILDASGETNLARDRGIPEDGDEPQTETPVERSISKFKVGSDVNLGAEKPAVLLRASAAAGLGFAYDLNVTIDPPCRAKEDKFEENDSRQAAAKLGHGKHKAHMCGGDDDWYRISTDAEDTLFVDVRPAGGSGNSGESDGSDASETANSPPKAQDFTVELVDPESGDTVAEGRPDGPFLTLAARDRESAGDLLVRVAAEDAETPYALNVYRYGACKAGDDDHEENDSVGQAASFRGKSKWHRYLRLCPDDPDYYEIKTPRAKSSGKGSSSSGGASGSRKPPEKFKVALDTLKADERNASEDDDPPNVVFDAVTRDGSKILASGRPVLPAPADASGNPSEDAESDEDPDPPFDQVITFDAGERKSVKVRVQGDPTFYHLVELSGTSNSRKQRKKQKKDGKNKDGKNKDGKNKDGKKKDGQKKDGEQNDEKSKKQDSQKKRSKQDSEKKKNDGRDGDQNREKAEQRKKKASKGQKSDEDAKRRKKSAEQRKEARIRDILKALEDSDTNFQMKKALEDAPNRYIEKDW